MGGVRVHQAPEGLGDPGASGDPGVGLGQSAADHRRRRLLSLSPERPGALADIDPTASLYPAPRNTRFTIDRPVTPEAINTNYNNFFEFGLYKQISRAAERLPIRPWQIAVDGLVEKEFTIAFDDLIRKMQIEERLYRHRSVEGWSMTVPWTGFPLAALVAPGEAGIEREISPVRVLLRSAHRDRAELLLSLAVSSTASHSPKPTTSSPWS